MSNSRVSSYIRSMLMLGLFAALIVVLGGLPGSAAAASCTTDCYVDGVNGLDSNSGESDSPLKTIQAAVDQVSNGGTVHVAAATYVEQVVISKSLALSGAGAATTFIKAPASMPIASNPDSTIIKVAGAGVSAEISDFTITGPGPGNCGTILAGIVVRDGAYANIHDNKIIDVRDTNPASGCQNGIAIFVGRQAWASSGTADITDNEIIGYQKSGIVVDNTGSHANITGNTIAGDGPITYIAENGIQISRGATANITSNSISGHSYTPYTATSAGLLIWGAGTTTIDDNQLVNNQIGINISDSSPVTIVGNNISATNSGTGSPYYWGISFFEATGASMIVDITDNTFSSNNSPGGFAISSGAGYGAYAIDLDITNNVISNWDYGVAFECNSTGCGAGFSNLHINNNSIAGNNTGIHNEMSFTVDAENNWWGHASGPSGEGPGSGNSVSSNVDYDPWLGANPLPTKVNLSADAPLICAENASLNIDFSNVPNLYGYTFAVTYNNALATATGAFVNDWFDTTNDAIIVPGWNAECSGGTCQFSVSHLNPAPPSGGGGTVATIEFARQSAGTFSAAITDIVLTDIDGFQIPYSSDTASVSFDVCGQASISGAISLQGRLTPMDAGEVKLINLDGDFDDIVVPFDAATGAYSFPNIPVLPGGSEYRMEATHILYLGNQKTMSGVNSLMPNDVLTNQNTRLLGGDADNSGLNTPFTIGVDMTDIVCIGNAFGSSGSPICGPNPNSSTDINKDNITNIQDLSLAGGNYFKNPFQNW